MLSGGSDLLVQLREGRKQADVIVDLKVLPQANGVSLNGGLKLGAAVPCQKIYRDEDIAKAYPCLIDSASLIGGMQIQARASLGGNLCNSSPAADSIPSLLVLGTMCHIRGPQGERTVPATEFCTGVGTNVLQKGEYLESFEFPAPAAKSGAAFLRFIPRNEMDIAVANVAVWVQLDASGQRIEDARVAVGACAPTPLFVREAGEALKGESASSPDTRKLAEAARAACKPITDMRGSKEQRIHLAGVLAERALKIALERATA